MKNKILFFSISGLLLLGACNDQSSTDTESSSSGMSDTTVTSGTIEAPMIDTTEFASRSYIDLKTGNAIHLRLDSVTNKYVDINTNKEPGYYYDPVRHDTFDSRGYILNNSLTLKNGDYSIDEDKMMANPDNIKIKNDGSKMKVDENSMKMKNDSEKIKDKAGKYKEKTEDTKVKVTDDKMKVKSK